MTGSVAFGKHNRNQPKASSSDAGSSEGSRVGDVDACLMVTMRAATVDPPLRRWLADGLGSVILFGANLRTAADAAAIVRELRATAPDLLVAVDEEGGDVNRLERTVGSSYPGNLALGELNDVAATEQIGGALGDLLAAAGIDLDLAPVADVNSNPDNPVIGSRSFGADPARVAAHTAAYVRGVQSRGVAACAKHFPGHGAAATDSHEELPIVDAPADVLSTVDLEPFRAAIAAGARSVMTAHVVYPAWDPGVPATLSRPILTDLLRGELGFAGVLITDALHMAAIRDGVGCAEGAVQALAAGADLVCVDLDLPGQVAVRDAVAAAVADGRLPAPRVAEA
ncbi:MAG: beta-N-acetylhexosaminidase, partial [Mycobacteriales bacterium]